MWSAQVVLNSNIDSQLSKAGIEYASLYLTATGLDKCICDATQTVRDYFEQTNYHFYSEQKQGTENKIVHPAIYVGSDGALKTDVRLYRPNTKKGDPRIWFGGIKKNLRQDDILVLTIFEGVLYVFNASQRDLIKDLNDQNSLLRSISAEELAISDDANLLMSSLRDIYQMGFVKSLRKGDTGVGYTLEELLGIKANSSKEPDIFGIELKAGRLIRGKSRPKSQLFSKTPDWQNSPKSAWASITSYGYPRGQSEVDSPYSNYCLRCTIDSSRENTQGLILEVRADDACLWARHLPTEEDVFLWGMHQLKDQLSKKHRETFWVGADVKKTDNGHEEFRYSTVLHTRKPSLTAFERLLGDGGISVDLTMKVKNAGNKTVRDHGYLFKVKTPRFTELFPIIQDVSLSQ
jgi:hypothetical protein